MVAVFDAKIGELQKRMKKHNAPFIVVADERMSNTKSGVTKSSSNSCGALCVHHSRCCGRPQRMRSSHHVDAKTINNPVDILIDEEGKMSKHITVRIQQIIFLLRK